MSYCVALKLSHGLVFMSDTLTRMVGLIIYPDTPKHSHGELKEKDKFSFQLLVI